MNFLVIIMILAHTVFFIFESILWGKPFANKVFKQSKESANILKIMAFNQGFYNLFIVIALTIGLVCSNKVGFEVQAATLRDYGAASALGAGLVLVYSEPKLYRGALIQALPALIYWILRFI